jgi:predicted nucleotidyltransferase/DNA-binding transcriptional ArsR family regulator
MIPHALFSPSLQRILALLFVRVDDAFYLNEIIRLTGLGSATVQRELQRLTSAGLILSQRVGNLRRFQANHDHPVYAELHGLIKKSFGLIGVLQNAIEPMLPSLRCAFVYGSTARGTETAASDIDVMLVGDSIGYGIALSAFSTAEQELGRKINPTLYTPAEFRSRQQEQHHFLMRVLEQPKLFLTGDDDALRRLGQPGQDSQVESRTGSSEGV